MQGFQNVILLASGETLSGDDCDLFFFVKLLVQLLVLVSNCLNKDQTLVLG